MGTVAIIGAGPVGGATAHALTASPFVRRLVIVDETEAVASGKALDIGQAGPIAGSDVALTATSALGDAGLADVIVVADRAAGGEWQGEAALALVGRLASVNTRAPFVIAGPSAAWLVERAAVEHRVAAPRLVGSAPLAFAAAVGSLVALELETSAADVCLTLVGRPPKTVAVLWDQSSCAGVRLDDRLPTGMRRAIERRAAGLWPPGPYASASAAAAVVSAVLSRSHRLWPCTVWADEGGRRTVAAFPVHLGPSGVRRVVIPSLTPAERVVLGEGWEPFPF